MTKQDRTFSEISAYGSNAWCALRLGRSLDWFRKERAKLEMAGFPPVDRITGLTQKADVDAWLEKRRRVADREERKVDETKQRGINYDAI